MREPSWWNVPSAVKRFLKTRLCSAMIVGFLSVQSVGL